MISQYDNLIITYYVIGQNKVTIEQCATDMNDCKTTLTVDFLKDNYHTIEEVMGTLCTFCGPKLVPWRH